MKWRLLPEDKNVGWTPYAWLIYAVPFALAPAWRQAGAWDWVVNTAGLLVFLGLYFRAFWMMGPQLVWIAAGMTTLGLVYTSWNLTAVTFFTYAGVFLGWTGQTRAVVVGTLAIAGLVGVEGWWLGWPWAVRLSGMVLPVLFGFVMLHFAERERADAKLRLAQEEVEQMARMAERERIARDLHDLLGHTLSVIVLKAELAGKLAERDPARAVQEIREVEGVAREALREVRGAVTGYRSLGLKSELARAAGLLRDAGLEVESEYGEVEWSAMEESMLTLVLREAVTNVLRHARAQRCELGVGSGEAGRELWVVDNGVGMRLPEGAGLTGMRERVAMVGGRLEVEGGAGTRVRVWLPGLAA